MREKEAALLTSHHLSEELARLRADNARLLAQCKVLQGACYEALTPVSWASINHTEAHMRKYAAHALEMLHAALGGNRYA